MDKLYSICIGRELCSGGRNVAKLLAEKLGLNYYDKEIIYHAAEASGISPELFEKADEKATNLFFGTFLSNDKLFSIQSDVMINLAKQHSSVFVGRCADYVLRDLPNVYSFFLTANREDRIERLCKDLSICGEEALQIMEKADKRRADYYNFYTFKKWGNSASYDMCFNTSLLGIEGTAELIISILEQKMGCPLR